MVTFHTLRAEMENLQCNLAYQEVVEVVKAQYLHDGLRGARSIVSSAKLLSKSCAIHVET